MTLYQDGRHIATGHPVLGFTRTTVLSRLSYAYPYHA